MTEKELFFTYHQDIFRTCYYMLQNKQDAEDICHEVFMKVFQRNYQSIEKLKPWMLSIAMNECRNALKKRSRSSFFSDLLDRAKIVVSPDNVEKEMEESEQRSELMNVVSKLPLKIQEVIILKYLHELKNEEVAEVLNIPLGTVKSRANKGISLLRNMIGDQHKPFVLSKEVAK